MAKSFWNATLTAYLKNDLEGTRLKLLLTHKEVPVTIRELNQFEYMPPDELALVNPNHIYPCLTDKNLCIHGTSVIDEYLNERYPYPQLLPFEPKDRAVARFVVRELCNLYTKDFADYRDTLWEALWSASPWALGPDFTLVDLTFAPFFIHYDTRDAPVHARDYRDRLLHKIRFETVKQELRKCA